VVSAFTVIESVGKLAGDDDPQFAGVGIGVPPPTEPDPPDPHPVKIVKIAKVAQPLPRARRNVTVFFVNSSNKLMYHMDGMRCSRTNCALFWAQGHQSGD